MGRRLAEVRGAYNAIRVVGDAVGRVFFHGLGAGQMPTASAVVADLIDTVIGRKAITFRRLNLWSTDGEAPVSMRDPAKVPGRFYLRFNVDDRPGVMSDITGILGNHGISIASVIQHETEEDASNVVPLVIMTHTMPEGAMHEAMKTIGQLASVHPGSVQDEGEGLGIRDWGLEGAGDGWTELPRSEGLATWDAVGGTGLSSVAAVSQARNVWLVQSDSTCRRLCSRQYRRRSRNGIHEGLLRYLAIAQGSLAELETHLMLAERIKYCTGPNKSNQSLADALKKHGCCVACGKAFELASSKD